MKEGWTYRKLGELCEVLDSQRRPVTKRDRKEGAYPYYGASGVQDYVNSYIFDGRFLLVGEDGAKWGPSDKSAFIIEGKCWVNNHVHILKVSETIIDKLLEYYLVFEDLSVYITGAIVPKLTQKALVNIEVPVPPCNEQQQMVSELDLLSDVIKKQKTQIEELDKLAQSTFYDMFGDPLTNEKGWEVKQLHEIAKLSAGGDVPKEHFSSKYTDEYSIPIFSNSLEKDGLYGYTNLAKINNPSLTVAGRGVNVGMVFLRETPYYPIIRLITIEPKIILDLRFLKKCVENLKLKGNGGAIPQLTVPMIKNEFIPLPPLALQQEFAAKVEAIEQMKAKVRQSLKESEELFNSRMDYYFN